ncbi:hypothetical protein TBLA_0F03050 [Henningerozyma blattae CBS 6284]|uniref:STAS domain-containing protein n=1 Tax=Henningerozyma blattae (strain ATCC 34711 / CBS 6284 / DSM 70876 / NBRC 10599 / NRRL Y-10934 / UCD 77-7) TaxID=1071380 RepID=I2H642_HENB6|nr:hypothetical protein TBLA_0F03050 [Tetrapisispora blattae CBS 6284]CCH61844.1 hypothetical protein TBLA_0F03050 [Tetrapisispora blattae CBS 6284]
MVYREKQVTLIETFNHRVPRAFTWQSIKTYLLSLLPITKWIAHYNLQWFISDVIAGITVGCVLVPQSMSYAQIATLDPQYGLYSSIMGCFIYTVFATSKDICIGPVAIMSLQTAKAIAHVHQKHPDIPAHIIASTIAVICGAITMGIGVLRLGFFIDLIPVTAVFGFTSGSAFNILWGQIPGLMGYSKDVNTRQDTYKVVVDTLKKLPKTNINAVMGLIPLFCLFVWKYGCDYALRRGNLKPWPKRIVFYLLSLRVTIVIIICSAAAYGAKNPSLKVLGKIPKGFAAASDNRLKSIPSDLVSDIWSEIPASVIVLVLEHVSIAKSFARVNNYRVSADQELTAIGVSNVMGACCLGAYPVTGSFSRTALKARCEVRTPLGSIFSGLCVVVAITSLTSALAWIPKATLSAVIIHAVSGLISSYKVTIRLYKMGPLDCLGFLVTIFITVFSEIEIGVYFAVCWACFLLMIRIAFPYGAFLGYVRVREISRSSITMIEPMDYESGNDKENIKLNKKQLTKKYYNKFINSLHYNAPYDDDGTSEYKNQNNKSTSISTSSSNEPEPKSSTCSTNEPEPESSTYSTNEVISIQPSTKKDDQNKTQIYNVDEETSQHYVIKGEDPTKNNEYIFRQETSENSTIVEGTGNLDNSQDLEQLDQSSVDENQDNIINKRLTRQLVYDHELEHDTPTEIIWIPYSHRFTRELNPHVKIHPPPPGVVVYRFSDSLTYINCSRNYDNIIDYIKDNTKPGEIDVLSDALYVKPWNNPGPWEKPKLKFWEHADPEIARKKRMADKRPTLRILCLDFSQVAQIDSTALQALIDLRHEVNAYTCSLVEWHFCGIISPWVRRNLIEIGFGKINKEFFPKVNDSSTVEVISDLEYNGELALGENVPFFICVFRILIDG